MSENAGAVPEASSPPSIPDIFISFAAASLSGFGGVMPFARRMIVERRKWMTAEEFNEAFSLAQFVPGPNMLNFSIVFGSRKGGPLGAVAAAAGLVAPPVILVMALGALYARWGQFPALQNSLQGLAAAAAGLIIAAAAKMTEPLFRRGAGPAPYVAVAVFLMVAIARWPLLWVLAAGMPVSVLLAWWWRR
jgi:chromate transporter